MEQELVEMQCIVRMAYEVGRRIEEDRVKAMGLYVKAEDQGQEDVQFKVEMWYEEGMGCLRSERAVALILKRDGQGHPLVRGMIGVQEYRAVSFRRK